MTWILPKQLHTLACALDTEALSLDLNESSRICEQSLFVRSKRLRLPIWLRKWKRDSWTQHLFGRILKPSLGNRFATEWISSLEGIPVSHSVQQASEREKMTQDIYGLGLQMELLQCDQVSVSLKMSKDISRWGCPTSSKTWEEWVTEQRGAYSARLKLARLTSASGSSSWPTSSARDWKGCYTTLQRKDGKMRGDLLPDAVNLEEKSGRPALANTSMDGNRPESWETPTVSTGAYRQSDGSMTPKLDQQVKLWRTPSVAEEKNQAYSQQIYLQNQVGATPKAWATPHANCSTGAGQSPNKDGAQNLQTQANGKLNPRWVETLMGLPVGWTMPSCACPATIEPTNSDS